MSSDNKRNVLSLLIFILATVGMSAFVATHLRWTDAITHFLAPGQQSDSTQIKLAEISRGLAKSQISRQMSLLVASEDLSRSAEATDFLVSKLEGDPEIQELRHHWDDAFGQDIHKIYFPRRIQFLSSNPEQEIPELLSDKSLAQAASALKDELRKPSAAWIKQLAPEDPLLLVQRSYQRIKNAHYRDKQIQESSQTKSQEPGVQVREGRLWVPTEEGSGLGAWVILLTTRHSPFESEYQGPLEERIQELIAEAKEQFGDNSKPHAGLSIRRSGIARFALRAEQEIRGDIQRISLVSSLALACLFLMMFPALRILVLVGLPIGTGILTGMFACLLVFGQMHGLTLAFGASLIGIAIDYPIHLVNHEFALRRNRSSGEHLEPRGASLRRVRPALLLGAGTSMVGFAGLGWTSFPGIREVAFFTAAGLGVALLVTLFVLPALLPQHPKVSRVHTHLLGIAGRVLEGLEALCGPRRAAVLGGLTVLATASVVLLTKVEFSDDVAALTPLDPKLQAEDEAVQKALSNMDAGRLVVALAKDEESALQINDRLATRLEELRSEGLLENYRSLHPFLRSQELQQRNFESFRQNEGWRNRLLRAFEAEGFRGEFFTKAYRDVLQDKRNSELSNHLLFSELLASPLAWLVRSHRIVLGDEVAVLSFLRSSEKYSYPKLQQRLSDLPGVFLLDQKEMMRLAYQQNRQQTLELMLFGLVAVLGVIFLRYRRWQLSLAACVPALLGAGGALVIANYLAGPLNLLHVVSLILVLCMGVDYGVFLVESSADKEERTVTLLSLALACMSTALAFGTLAWSANPALRAIGLTTGLGVAMSFLLAPLALVLAGRATTQERQR